MLCCKNKITAYLAGLKFLELRRKLSEIFFRQVSVSSNIFYTKKYNQKNTEVRGYPNCKVHNTMQKSNTQTQQTNEQQLSYSCFLCRKLWI